MRRFVGKMGNYDWSAVPGKVAPVLSTVQLWVTRHDASARTVLLIAMCALVTAVSFLATLFVLD